MEISIEKVAEIIKGQIVGDKNATISSFGKIEEAQAGSIAFLSNPKYEQYIYKTEATAVIVSKSFNPTKSISTNLIKVDDAYTAFTQLLTAYQTMLGAEKTGDEHPHFTGKNSVIGHGGYRGAFSYVGDHCKLGNNVKIYPNAVIGSQVTIGDGTIIYSGVKIYDGTVIGKNCVLHAGSVIGSDGFGFAPQKDGTYKAIPQIGNVVLEDEVSIGANTTIDCATMGSTVIKKGAKLDNLIQIAHNVEVGENTVVAAQAGISGSSKIGRNCIIAGQVGIVGHITIANKTTIGAQSGIAKSIKDENLIMSGSPAMDHKTFLKSSVAVRKLPEILDRINALEEKVINLSHNKQK